MKAMIDSEHRRVLLLNPCSRHAGFSVGRVHMGLSLLARILVDHGHLVKIVDYAFLLSTGRRIPPVDEVIRGFRPQVIGISVFTFLHRETLAMIDAASRLSRSPIVLGGPHITMFPDEFADDGRISYLVCGEAETVILELVENAECQSKPVLLRPHYPPAEQIPMAMLEVVHGVDRLHEYQIQLSRGCPFACSFCNIHIMAGRKPRARDLEICIEELVQMKRRYSGINSVVVTDDCPTFNQPRFKTFLRMFAEAKLNCKLNIDNLRAKDIDEELLDLYRKAGGQNICIGVESGNPDVFTLVNKGETLDDIIRGAKLVKRAGFELGLCFVIGLPEDSLERHRDSIEMAKSIKPDYIFWNMCVPWPNTCVMKWFRENGEVREVRNFSTLIAPYVSYGNPPAVSRDFPESERIKAWLMANMETYGFPFTIANVRKLRAKAREYGLGSSFRIFVIGRIPHALSIFWRKIHRVLKSMGPKFLLLFLYRALTARLRNRFVKDVVTFPWT